MAFWKKWWKKKNEAKKGAEYEDHPLPSEVDGSSADDPQLEQRIRARRNNLSVSRSGRFKAKGKERGQVVADLFQQSDSSSSQPNCGRPDAAGDASCASAAAAATTSRAPAAAATADQPAPPKGSFGKNSCREAQLALRAGGTNAATGPMPASIH